MSGLPEREGRLRYMRLALEEAAKCEPIPTAFCVGCVITVPTLGSDGKMTQKILSTGYSREIAGNTHAEANALAKAYALAGTEEWRQGACGFCSMRGDQKTTRCRY
ncbi:hypothetical protein RSAG8_01098, partial [Rhizoctonia solani AG-8 WAC10335]